MKHINLDQAKSILKNLASSPIFQNISSLYGVHFANYLLPLVTIPFLSRVLGPYAWGLLSFAQAFGQYVNLIIEYGFNLSATRETAKFRDNPQKLSDLLAGVFGAKVFLILISLVMTFIASRCVPSFKQHPSLLWLSLIWAITQSLNPIWFFQGLEKMRVAAILDIASKVIFTLGILFLIRDPSQVKLVLILQSLGSSFSSAIATFIAYRKAQFYLPKFHMVWDTLKLGWTMFLFRSAVSFYTIGNTFILGLFAAPEYVGYYAGAEKISKALLGLLNPISQALYPRINYLFHRSKTEAARLSLNSLKLMGSGGVLMGLLAFFFAPFWIRILLGEGYAPAIPALRMLSVLPPLIALSNVLGIQWMLILGLDKQFNFIIIIAGALNVLLAVLLAPNYLQNGMAISVVIAELFVTGGIIYILKIKHLTPNYLLKNCKDYEI